MVVQQVGLAGLVARLLPLMMAQTVALQHLLCLAQLLLREALLAVLLTFGLALLQVSHYCLADTGICAHEAIVTV
jgi:hypothetical protein